MHLVDTAGHIDNRFVAEDLSQVPPRPPTEIGPEIMNAFMLELANVVTLSGGTLDKEDNTQVYQAIQQMIASSANGIVFGGVDFEASVANGAVVRWDSVNNRFDEAVADGTANNRAIGVADVANSRLYVFGQCPVFTGLTPGQRYYLSSTVPGALVTTAPADGICVGVARSATTMILDIDGMGVRLDQANVWTKRQSGTVAALVSVGGSIAYDMSLPNHLYHLFTENTILAAPTNPLEGTEFVIEFEQPASPKTLGYNTFYKFPDGIIPAVSTLAGAKQKLWGSVDKGGASATCYLTNARS